MKRRMSRRAKKVAAAILTCALMITSVEVSGFGVATAKAAEGDIEINATNFPDEAFRNMLKANYRQAADDNILTPEEIQGIKKWTLANSK